MKKLIFLTLDNPLDRRSWSGTLYSELFELKKYYEVVPVVASYNKFLLSFIKLKERIIYIITKRTYIPFYASRFLSKMAARKVNKLLRTEKFDGVFCVCCSSVVTYIDESCPIYFMSDAVFSLMKDFYYKNMNRRNLINGEFFEKKSLAKSKLLFLASDWARNGAINDYNVEPHKAIVVPFGSNVNTSGITLYKSIDNSSKEIHVLFIGVDWDRKGGDLAIKTIYHLNSIQSEFKFFLEAIGGKPKYKVDENVIHLYGFINKNKHEELEKFIDIINLSYINILPTIAECSGIALVEASAYGIPSVTYNVGGTGTNIRNGENGFCLPLSANYIDFSDRIIELVKDKKLYEKMRLNGINYVKEKLNWEKWGLTIKNYIG